jgi:2-amino-4-hydroxy-6-hydroxymethyldihydropteridine diphosphokinase
VHEVTEGVAVALGSNTGDRLGLLREAVRRMDAMDLLRGLRCSHAYETPPERPGDGGPFLNAVVAGATRHSAGDLLAGLLELERSMGRVRRAGVQGGPRPIDLDLVLFGERVHRESGLEVPHPRFDQRAFVLVPLAEVMPNACDPRSGRSVHSLLASLPHATLPRVGSLK